MLSTNFDAVAVKNQIVQWIRDWFDENGKGCNAVIGISGGKDSTVAAGLLVEAIGAIRVYGVMLPQDDQPDINDSEEIIKYLGIHRMLLNIGNACDMIADSVNIEVYAENPTNKISNQALINLPARLRMLHLYAVAQSLNGRVVNTCNLSEDYVGYSTKYGDAAGDFAPLKSLTSEEVIAVGKALGLPEHLLTKVPSDGLCGKTDEDNLGFTYDVLNTYIRTGKIDDIEAKERIDRLHKINEFKEKQMERYILHPEMHIYFTEKCHV